MQGVSNSQNQNFLQHLTIKTQILLICLFFSTIIFGLSLTAILVGQDFINNVLRVASNQIFESQTQILLNNIWIYTFGKQESIEKTKHQISLVRNLHTFVDSRQQQHNSFQIEKPSMCLLNSSDQDKYCFNNTMCCGVFGKQLDNSLKNQLTNIMITTSLLNVYRLEFDFTKHASIYFTYDNEAQFYCHSLGFPFNQTYRPFSRSYYIEHLERIQNQTNPEECYFANPYKILTNRIRLPMTTSLLNLNNQFIGVIAKDLDFANLNFQKYYLQNITSYILTRDGLVVFSAKYQIANHPIFYINDSQYSGFTQDDYNQIMQKHYGRQFISNCLNFQSSDILCRHNADLADNVIIQTSNITGSPYIMLIMSQTNELKEQENNQLQFINSELSLIIRTNIIIMFFSSTGIIFLGQIIIIIILNQLNNISNKINNEIRSHKLINAENILQQQNLKNSHVQVHHDQDANFIQSSTVTNFTSQCISLFYKINSNMKCNECKYQENIQFPKMDRFQLKNFKFTKKQVKEITNRNSFSYKLRDMTQKINAKQIVST